MLRMGPLCHRSFGCGRHEGRPGAGGWGNLLGELLAHGDDIARATGSPFAIPSADLEILWRFTAPLLQGWIRPETAPLNEEWRLRFPFGDVDAVLDRGVLRVG